MPSAAVQARTFRSAAQPQLNDRGEIKTLLGRTALCHNPLTAPCLPILRNRSFLQRFSGCDFARLVNICFSGREQCGHHSAAFGV